MHNPGKPARIIYNLPVLETIFFIRVSGNAPLIASFDQI